MLDNNNYYYTWGHKEDYTEDRSSRDSYPATSTSRQDSAYRTTSASISVATPQNAHDERWDVEVRPGSFDGDTREPGHDLPEDHGAANEQATDFESHRKYTDQYINSLEVPLGYRDDTGDQQSSPRRRARRRVRDIVNADYAGQGSSGSGSGHSSSRHHKSSKNHHGHKSSKHSGQSNKRHTSH